MSNDTYIQIILAIFSIIWILFTNAVLPWLRSKQRANELETLEKYARLAVRCAEQIYTPEQWHMKKDYVMEWLGNVIDDKLHIRFTDAELNTLVEGIVNEVKYGN